jgi:acetyl-CoA acetyltransferase
MTRDMAWDYPLGLVAPANFALHVARYLHESPATREHMAMVAVKNHRHAVTNPKAQLRFEITVEQVLNAPVVVEPFGLYDCTPQRDVAEVHDCFTGVELISYEDLGFAERFGAYKLIEAGATSVGGSLPVNPSGGLKAKGHPPGATGVAQCVELFEQLRGQAANQVDGARIGLAHNIGGPTAVSAVTVLEGPGA